MRLAIGFLLRDGARYGNFEHTSIYDTTIYMSRILSTTCRPAGVHDSHYVSSPALAGLLRAVHFRLIPQESPSVHTNRLPQFSAGAKFPFASRGSLTRYDRWMVGNWLGRAWDRSWMVRGSRRQWFERVVDGVQAPLSLLSNTLVHLSGTLPFPFAA